MSDNIIIVDGVTKIYNPSSNRRKSFFGLSKQKKVFDESYDVLALLDISFNIQQGESFGIIGKNGSGKSTLLEIIAGTLQPTNGNVTVNGKLAALLELGSGFDQESTGADNVFISGLLLGMSKDEIALKYDEIVAFADIGEVLHRPVKTYSSGMLARLAFSVQVGLDPQILIVDEALSVGDYFFQQKCFKRLRNLKDNGLTLLFVSHDMGTVRDVCERAVWLDSGRLIHCGDSKAVINRFISHNPNDIDVNAFLSNTQIESVSPHMEVHSIFNDSIWAREQNEQVSSDAIIRAVSISDESLRPCESFLMGSTLKVFVLCKSSLNTVGHVSLSIMNKYNQIVFNTSSYLLGLDDVMHGESLARQFEFDIDLDLEAGEYSLQVTFCKIVGPNLGQRLDETDWIGPIVVRWDYENMKAPFLGMCKLNASCKVQGLRLNE